MNLTINGSVWDFYLITIHQVKVASLICLYTHTHTLK